MKKQILLFTIYFITVLSYSVRCGTITITGNVVGGEGVTIVHSNPIYGVNYSGFTKEINVGSSNTFKLEVNTDKAIFKSIYIPEIQKEKTFLLEPGQNYVLNIDVNNKENPFALLDANKVGQLFYDSLEGVRSSSMLENAERHMNKSPNIFFMLHKVERQRNELLARYTELHKTNKISLSFYNTISVDVNCYFSALKGTVLLLKYNAVSVDSTRKFPYELREEWKQVFKEYSPLNNEYLRSPWGYEFFKNYVMFKEFEQYNFSASKFKTNNKKGVKHSKHIEVSKLVLEGEILECYQARYLYFANAQRENEKELDILIDQFKSDYPTSSFNPYLSNFLE